MTDRGSEPAESRVNGSDLVRPVDRQALDAAIGAGVRHTEKLLDRASGGSACGVSIITTPSGGGSPEGMHIHEFEQVFYVLEGTMLVELLEEVHTVTAGTLVIFPRGVPHRNWNEGPDATVHVAINVPAPQLGIPSARPVMGSGG